MRRNPAVAYKLTLLLTLLGELSLEITSEPGVSMRRARARRLEPKLRCHFAGVPRLCCCVPYENDLLYRGARRVSKKL